MASDAAVLTRPERAARQIADLVRATSAGTRIGTKGEVREACGVSVGTFNEALRLAQSRGLVEVRPGPGGGLFAAEQSPLVRLGNSVLALDTDATTVADAIRIRDTLDPLVIADAAWHSSPADVAAYREQLTAMDAARERGDAVAFMAANWRLHDLLAQVNPSPMLRAIYTALLEVIRSHTTGVDAADGIAPGDLLADRYRVHADLVDAIAERDPDRLRNAIAGHSVRSTAVTTPTNTTAPIPAAPPVEEHSVEIAPTNTTAPIPAAPPVEEHSVEIAPTNTTAPIPAAPPVEEHSA